MKTKFQSLQFLAAVALGAACGAAAMGRSDRFGSQPTTPRGSTDLMRLWTMILAVLALLIRPRYSRESVISFLLRVDSVH